MRVLQRVFKGRGRQQLKPLAQIIAGLFKSGAQGAWYDPSDINLNWRYNLLTYTEQFDNAAWTKTAATVTANAVVAPDGTLTGDKLVENTSNAGHDVRQSGTISGTNTFSVYLKAAERTWALIQVGGTTAGFAYVNLTTGAIGTVTSGCTATAISVGNGWWRCSVTGVSASTSATVAGVYLALNDSSFQYTGDGTSGIYLWGAQLQTGSVATTYQQIVTPEISYLTYQPQPVLYQDAAGTTPVTAVEQPVGLMLDKSKGLVLGSELVTNGDFSSGTTGWTPNAAVTQSVVSGQLQLLATSGTSNFYTSQSVSVSAGKWYKITGTVTSAFGNSAVRARLRIANSGVNTDIQAQVAGVPVTQTLYILATGSTISLEPGVASTAAWGGVGDIAYFDNISVKLADGNHAFQSTAASRPVLSARYNLLTATETLATQSVTTRATTQKLTFTGTGSITLSGTATGTYTAGTYSVVTTAGTLTLTISGSVTKADLRASNESLNQPAYQRVNTSTDYDTVGFKPYLLADGVDDGMVTNSINFTTTDKMTVCAGVRKLSDAAEAMITELSANVDSNNGTFSIFAPGGISAVRDSAYVGVSKGTIKAFAGPLAAAYPAPITNVVTTANNISGDSVVVRINGAQVTQSTADQGTGNYGNYPLYLFRRGGTTLPFNGRFYGMTVVGKTVTDGELSSIEKYMNNKTGAY